MNPAVVEERASADGLEDMKPLLGPPHGEVAKLAYGYWEERGYPDGCPEEDWFRAEQRLRQT